MKTIAVVLLASILSATVGLAQKGTTEIPFTMDRNLILIKAKVNGKKEYSFIYDTGTVGAGLVLSETLVKDQKLKITGTTTIQSPNSVQPDNVNTVVVPKLKLNGFEIKNLDGVAVPPQNIFSPNASGIIGLNAFRGNLVTIDFKNSKLILKKGELDLNDKKVIKVDLSQFPEAYVKVNGEEMLAHFDSGGPEAISFPMEWKSKLKLKSEPVLVAKGRTPGGEVEIYKSQLVGTISFGSIELKDPNITLVTGGFNAINFGSPFFQKYTTTLDMVNQLMRFEAL
jgi:Aspartyl protease